MKDNKWYRRANFAQKQMESIFWEDEENVYRPFTEFYQEAFEDFHYWWMAHVADLLMDGFERTKDTFYIERLDQLLEGIGQRTNHELTNNYYDDMEWLALAILRAFTLTDRTDYLKKVRVLWEDILTGWNDHCGGGIAWRKQQLDYKNTPANAPAVILGLRLYRISEDENDLNWAHKIFDWLENHLVDHDTGFVWDGMNREGDMKIDYDWDYTYNQGVYAGACIEFYRLSSDTKFLDKAMRTIKLTFKYFGANNTNILRGKGDGDVGLFKGIFIRYAEEILSYFKDDELFNIFIENGEAAWNSLDQYHLKLFGINWLTNNTDQTVTLATHLSGAFLMETNYRLSKNYTSLVKQH